MILFDKANPLDDLAEIVRLANPVSAAEITGDNIAVDNIKVIDPVINDGFNTEAEIRMIGGGTAVGLVKVRFNRIDLRKYVPEASSTNRVRVGVVTAANKRADIVKIAPRLSKALGSMFDVSGPYKDYTNTGTWVINKGAVTENYLEINPDSLRYVPGRFHFKAFGLGVDIAEANTQPAIVPFLKDNGGLLYGKPGEIGFIPDADYIPAEGKRSALMTIGMCDFTSVWGTDPSNVIELSDIEGQFKYRFNADAFEKINLILSTVGLPPLSRPDFKAWARGGSANYVSPLYPEVNYHLYIHNDNHEWDYQNLANLHGESNSHRSYVVFPYRT